MSVQKTYQVTVTFTSDTSESFDEDTIQIAELRNNIKKRIEEVSRVSKGIYSGQPGTVSES